MTAGLMNVAVSETADTASETPSTPSTPETQSVSDTPPVEFKTGEAVHKKYDHEIPTDQLEAPEASSTEWFWSDGVKGEGPKPDWYNEKTFKSIADQAKAQTELRKKLGESTGAPETYDPALTADVLQDYQIDPDAEVLKDLGEFCHQNHISQDGFTKLINGLAKFVVDGEQNEEKVVQDYQKEELTKLGDNAQGRLNELAGWLKQQGITDDKLTSVRNWIQSAEDVETLEFLRSKTGYTKIQSQSSAPQHSDIEVANTLREQMKDPRYSMDNEYTKWVDKRYRDHYEPKFANK